MPQYKQTETYIKLNTTRHIEVEHVHRNQTGTEPSFGSTVHPNSGPQLVEAIPVFPGSRGRPPVVLVQHQTYRTLASELGHFRTLSGSLCIGVTKSRTLYGEGYT